jgi:hypothetical protein
MKGKVFPQRCLRLLVISGVMLLASGGMLTAQDKPPGTAGAGETTGQPMVEETEWGGVKAELTSIERTSGDMLTIKFKYTNSGSKEVDITRLGQFSHDNVVEHIYYVDTQSKKKYLVVKDAEGKALGTNLRYFKLEPNGAKAGWAKFPAPAADVQKISVYLPGAPPFEDVAIR